MNAPLAEAARGVSIGNCIFSSVQLGLAGISMQSSRLLGFVLVALSLAGCGDAGDAPVNVTPPTSTEQLKAALNDVVQSGQLGSGGMTIEQEIEKIRATDAAKADTLKKGYDELKAATSPEAAKAKAQEMISKL